MVCLLPILFQPTLMCNTQGEFRISFLPLPLFSDTLHVNCPKAAPPSHLKSLVYQAKLNLLSLWQ